MHRAGGGCRDARVCCAAARRCTRATACRLQHMWAPASAGAPVAVGVAVQAQVLALGVAAVEELARVCTGRGRSEVMRCPGSWLGLQAPQRRSACTSSPVSCSPPPPSAAHRQSAPAAGHRAGSCSPGRWPAAAGAGARGKQRSPRRHWGGRGRGGGAAGGDLRPAWRADPAALGAHCTLAPLAPPDGPRGSCHEEGLAAVRPGGPQAAPPHLYRLWRRHGVAAARWDAPHRTSSRAINFFRRLRGCTPLPPAQV